MLDEQDPEKRLQMRLQVTDRIEDPLQRAIAQAGIYATYNMEDKYIQTLKDALEIDPKARVVVARRYRRGKLLGGEEPDDQVAPFIGIRREDRGAFQGQTGGQG